MAFTYPTVADFKTRFDRDFRYSVPLTGPGTGDATDINFVRDVDITRGFTSALVNWASGLWPTQAIFSEMFLLLSAHEMCDNLLSSTQGLNGQYTWLVGGKGAAGVSSQHVIPDRIKNSPFLSGLSTTRYGAQYVKLLIPYLTGNMQLAPSTGQMGPAIYGGQGALVPFL